MPLQAILLTIMTAFIALALGKLVMGINSIMLMIKRLAPITLMDHLYLLEFSIKTLIFIFLKELSLQSLMQYPRLVV